MADYLTLSEVKAQSLLDLGTDYDTMLPIWITRASRLIDREAKRRFDVTTAVKLFDGSGTKVLTNIPDLAAITQLRIKVGGTLGVWQTVPASDYFLEPANRDSGRPGTWLEISDQPSTTVGAYKFDEGKRTVEITGDWGYPSIPEEIKGVCMEVVVKMWRMKSAGYSDQSGGDNLDQVITPRALSQAARMVLADHTKSVIG